MGRHETENKPETHGSEGEYAVVTVFHDHLFVSDVDSQEREEEQISGDERDDRRIYIIG